MKSFLKCSTLALMVLVIALSSCSEKDDFTTEVIDFQSVALEPDSYWNGSDGAGEMVLGMASFNNSYDSNWGAWSGFAISNVTDTETAGWSNQYSAYVASEPNAGNNYAVSYVTGTVANITFITAVNLQSVKITNSTYAYHSILNGDDYTRKFEDGDWFLLTIVGFNSDEEILGEEMFYLADFRNSASVIVDDWTKIDLRGLKGVTKIVFHLTSSDVGEFGINTPAYFCMDDLVYTYMN